MMKRKIFFLLTALLCAALLAGCSGSALDIFFFPDAVAHGDRGTDTLPHRGADADTRTDAGAACSL